MRLPKINMTVDQFIAKYLNKPLNVDGAYGNQCVDVFQAYDHEVILGHAPSLNAINYWYSFDANLYTQVVNTITAIPLKGDVIIWNVGKFGHIGIFISGDENSFISFDQNWPSQGYYDKDGNFIGTGVCHQQAHENYANVVGWLHPKQSNVIQLPQMPPYLVTLFQQQNLDFNNEGATREFWQKAVDYPGVKNDLSSNQTALVDAKDKLSKAELDNQSLTNQLNITGASMNQQAKSIITLQAQVAQLQADNAAGNLGLDTTSSFVKAVLAFLRQYFPAKATNP